MVPSLPAAAAAGGGGDPEKPGPGALFPRPPESLTAPEAEPATAWWALDVSEARPVIDAIAAEAGPPDWMGALLSYVRIADVDPNNVHLLGPYGGRARMVGQPFTSLCPPESWQVGAELILAVVADYPAGAQRMRRITSLTFGDAWARASTDPSHPDIVFIAVGGTIIDDRSLWAVRASEQRYRSLFQYLPYALIEVDSRPMRPVFEHLRRTGVTDIKSYLEQTPDLPEYARNAMRVTGANRSALELLGISKVEDLSGSIELLFASSAETVLRVMGAHFDGLRNYGEVMKLRTLDGRLLDVELSLTFPAPPDRLDITILGLVDITERLRTQAQLRQLEADYSRAARISMLGEVATSIAHEINQPLSAIVTNAETSRRWLARAEPNLAKVRQLTERIAESARRASNIVQRIRNMASKRSPVRAAVSLNEVIDEALLFVRHEIESRAIRLSLQLGKNLPPVFGDRVQLQQVVANLLINAVQAMNGRRGEIGIRTAHGGKAGILFTIHDDGPGIAPENLDRVFSSFFSTKDDGIGIGLALCQSIIASHHGTIGVSNDPRGGAVFTFWLPSAPESGSGSGARRQD